MARRSQWDAVLQDSERRKRFFAQNGRARKQTGFSQSYVYNRGLPVSPPTAYYLRRYSSLWDALKAWRADRPIKTSKPEAWAMIPAHIDVASRIMAGLSDHPAKAIDAAMRLTNCDRATAIAGLMELHNNYDAAERALLEWCAGSCRAAGWPEGEPIGPRHSDPRMRVAWEALFWVRPLITAYADPKRFFCEIAPKIDSNRLFDHEQLGPFDHPFISLGRLAEVLHTWGYGALLNPTVKTAFDAAAKEPRELVEILAEAEGKETYIDGPPVGKTKGKPKKRHVDNAATKALVYALANEFEKATGAPRGGGKVAVARVALDERISPGAVRQRVKRARRRE